MHGPKERTEQKTAARGRGIDGLIVRRGSEDG